jgi:hypothetical protein
MALTPTETNAIKRYLGYDLVTPDAWRGDAAAGLDRNIERLNAAGETTVRAVLTELAAVDTSITAARGRLKAAQVGKITLNAGEVPALLAERSRLSGELGRLLGVAAPASGPGRIIV